MHILDSWSQEVGFVLRNEVNDLVFEHVGTNGGNSLAAAQVLATICVDCYNYSPVKKVDSEDSRKDSTETSSKTQDSEEEKVNVSMSIAVAVLSVIVLVLLIGLSLFMMQSLRAKKLRSIAEIPVSSKPFSLATGENLHTENA